MPFHLPRNHRHLESEGGSDGDGAEEGGGASIVAGGDATPLFTSIAGVRVLTANQLIATMPELGSLNNKQAASLAGLAPIARQSGQ